MVFRISKRPRLVAMNRMDMAPEVARNAWRRSLEAEGAQVFFTNSKLGDGVAQLKRAALQAGSVVNEKRERRGLLPRAIRCVVIGYPNVGKSALINRLVKKRAAKSANRPGVTRGLQWVRISDTIELLDTPGIIPMKLVSQDAASKLAICDDIGEASYDNQLVAVRISFSCLPSFTNKPLPFPLSLSRLKLTLKVVTFSISVSLPKTFLSSIFLPSRRSSSKN